MGATRRPTSFALARLRVGAVYDMLRRHLVLRDWSMRAQPLLLEVYPEAKNKVAQWKVPVLQRRFEGRAYLKEQRRFSAKKLKRHMRPRDWAQLRRGWVQELHYAAPRILLLALQTEEGGKEVSLALGPLRPFGQGPSPTLLWPLLRREAGSYFWARAIL